MLGTSTFIMDKQSAFKENFDRTYELFSVNVDKTKFNRLLQLMLEFEKDVCELENLDTSLQEYLYTTKNTHEIIQYNDFQNQMDKIPEDSLIIYIKKAQLYKVYESSKLEDFELDNNTHYRRREYGPAYEVVRDSHPQKLMIVVDDDLRNDKLTNIKNNIVEFVKTNPEFSSTGTDDLKVFANNDSMEFVVSSVQLQNLVTKEHFIERFIRFMHKKGETELAGKIQVRPPPCEIEGARYYELPSVKNLISGDTYDALGGLVSAATKRGVVNIIINTDNSVNNNNYGNINTINNKSTIKPRKKTKQKTIESFYEYIYDTRPNWYLEGKLVNLDVIEEEYRNYFDDRETTKAIISKTLNGKLFSSGTRTNNKTKKRLVFYDVLKTLF